MKRPLIIMYTLLTASLLATMLALLHCAELDFVYDNPCDKTGINYQGCHDWTITFDPNGGTLTTTSVTTDVGNTLGSLPTPARTGYTFKGWYTASTSGTKVTEDRKYNGNTTIYAQWTPIDYTITYDLDGGNVSSANRASYNIETTAITLRNPTKTGYTFAGWTGTNGMPATTVVIQSGSTGDRSYTAQWTLNKYRITFNANSGTVTPAFDSTGAGWTLASLPTPTREGYAFSGWWTAATDGDSVTVSRVYSTNTNIYAKWNALYIITFNANGGTLTTASSTTGAGGKLASLPTPTRDNYIFNGWYTASTGGTQVTTSTVFSGNITIYARWGEATFADSRDGKSYKRVQIGNQVWMAENLNYDVLDNTAGVCYNNSANNCVKYGRLYNWSTAMNGASSSSTNPSGVQGVCPFGWHLPSGAEWTQLTDYVGGAPTAGRKLKSQSGWSSCGPAGSGSSYVCEDTYGFSALPGGFVYSDGRFDSAGSKGFWWSATESSVYYAYYWYVDYYNEHVYMNDLSKNGKFSVRCVQD